jgi:hypothetical protein
VIRLAELKELAWLWPFDQRDVRCAQRAEQRTRALTVPEPNVALLFDWVSCLPTALGCQLREAENSVCRRFSGSSDARQVFNICRIDYGD